MFLEGTLQTGLSGVRDFLQQIDMSHDRVHWIVECEELLKLELDLVFHTVFLYLNWLKFFIFTVKWVV